jgi:hypothetical protein
MPDDSEFIARYKNNHLYIHPGKAGAYATIAGESEEVIGEIDVTVRSKIAISAFYVNDRRDLVPLKSLNSSSIPGSAGANAEASTLTVSN